MKLTIIGAGGVRTPLLIHSIFKRQKILGIHDLTLMDIDYPRLQTISSVTKQLETSDALAFKIHRTQDLGSALEGADFVITTFRVGGIESRVIDERVPLEFGLLGQETTGAGGFAMGLRSIPVLLQIHENMELLCPNAWLINFANPAGMMIQAMENCTKRRRMVGICDAPSQFVSVFAGLLNGAKDKIDLDYFGLNHLGWIRHIRHGGVDHLPEIIQMFVDLGEIPQFPFDPELISSIGLIPNEYLYYYYYSRKAVENIKRSNTTRGEVILAENTLLFNKLNYLLEKGDLEGVEHAYSEYIGKRGDSYMQNETGGEETQVDHPLIALLVNTIDEGYAGVALDVIEGLIGKNERRMILNIPNQGAITCMGDHDVVEIPAWVSKDHIEPIPVGEIPDACLGLMKTIKAYEHITVSASVQKSYELAVQALTIHPLVGDYQLARKILKAYQDRHGDYFPELM